MRKKIEIKNLIRNNRYIILSKGEGGHSPLLHTGYPQKRNGHRHVMLNLFQHLATVEFHGYSKRLPQRRNIGQTLNQVQGDMKMLDCTPAKVQRCPLYIPSPLGGKVAGGRMRGQSGTLKYHNDPSPLPHLSQKQSPHPCPTSHKNNPLECFCSAESKGRGEKYLSQGARNKR